MSQFIRLSRLSVAEGDLPPGETFVRPGAVVSVNVRDGHPGCIVGYAVGAASFACVTSLSAGAVLALIEGKLIDAPTDVAS